MTTLNAHESTLSEGGWEFVSTGAADEQSLASTALRRDTERGLWQDIIDGKLVEWGRDPSQLDDEGIDSPTPQTIKRASQIALFMRDQGMPAPSRIVPTGDGGIVFERQQGVVFETIEIGADGSIEVALYQDCALIGFRSLLWP